MLSAQKKGNPGLCLEVFRLVAANFSFFLAGTARRDLAIFRLIAVIEHKGNSCHSGHYVAYVRRRRFVLPGSPRGTASAETPKGGAAGGSHASAEMRKRLGLFRSGSSPPTPLGRQFSGYPPVPQLPAATNRRITHAEEGGGGPSEAKTEKFCEDGTEVGKNWLCLSIHSGCTKFLCFFSVGLFYLFQNVESSSQSVGRSNMRLCKGSLARACSASRKSSVLPAFDCIS